MEKKLIIPKNRLLLLVSFNLGAIIYWFIAKRYELVFSDFFSGMVLATFTITWFVVLADQIRNKIYNKTFWIISMFIIPHISSLIYLIRRERLIILGHKF